ncbi:MAG TPA: hypothetical protein ACFE0H_08410 [Elainellaceae cyanobacterium]
MKPEATKSDVPSPSSESSKRRVKRTALFFSSGAAAGLITFLVFGGIWQVTHFWWVLAAVTFSSGVLAVVLRKNFQAMLSALLDDAPPI